MPSAVPSRTKTSVVGMTPSMSSSAFYNPASIKTIVVAGLIVFEVFSMGFIWGMSLLFNRKYCGSTNLC